MTRALSRRGSRGSARSAASTSQAQQGSGGDSLSPISAAATKARARSEGPEPDFSTPEHASIPQASDAACHMTGTTLQQLTPDALASILLLLPLHDVCAVARTCSRLRDAAMDDTRLWLPLCASRWGVRTALSAWMPSKPHRHSSIGLQGGFSSTPLQQRTSSCPDAHHTLSPCSSSMAPGFVSVPPHLLGGSPPMLQVLASQVSPMSSEPLIPSASAPIGGAMLGGQPRTYRMLYRLLLSMEGMSGTWRGVGKDCNGTLYHIGWRDGHMECVQLMCNTRQLDPLPRCPLFRLGPTHPNVVAHAVGSTHCVVKEYPAAGPRPLSAAAEAAAAVAAGGALVGSCSRSGAVSSPSLLQGSSPPSSFSHELAYFMQASVRGNARRYSNSLRGSKGAGLSGTSPSGPTAMSWQHQGSSGAHGVGPGACLMPSGVPVEVHTWVRVKQPQQTRQHPLAGLWKGLHGRHGAQVLSVQYDFQGSTARIVATKVTGDRDVPAGLDSWVVSASPLPMPLAGVEAALVSQRQQLLLRQRQLQHQDDSASEDEDNDSVQALQFLGLDDTDSGSESGSEARDDDDAGVAGQARAEGSSTSSEERSQVQVVACYTGKGRLGKPGGGTHWVEGRLWLYDSGNMCFCWLLEPVELFAIGNTDEDDQGHVLLPGAVLVEYLRLDRDTATG